MPWDDIARAQHTRKTDRYPSDMSDDEWSLLEPMVPPARSRSSSNDGYARSGHAIFYIGSTGCQWRALPKDFPPMTTVQGYFYNWRNAGVLEAMNDLLVVAARELADRAAEPTAGVIDSQSVKTTESGGICGYDAGKKTKGRKRHIVTEASSGFC